MFVKLLLVGFSMGSHLVELSFIILTLKSAKLKDGICCFIENAFQLLYKAIIVSCGEQ